VDLREGPLLPVLRQSVTQTARAAAARDIRIGTRDLPDLMAYADPRLLARVVDNVLANAVFYNRDGGRIEISGAAADRSAALEMVVITVRDTGTGIPPSAAERVFEQVLQAGPVARPWNRGKRSRAGDPRSSRARSIYEAHVRNVGARAFSRSDH
jgi:signal transduction histidine kinase